jgi:aminoglycoside 6'-N-acetyltransferase
MSGSQQRVLALWADVSLRALRREDLPLLTRWLQAPHVREWWRGEPTDQAEVEAKYGACLDGGDPTDLFVIEVNRHPVGMIQRYRFADEPEWSAALSGITDLTAAAGVDYLIGEPEAVGHGVASSAISALVAQTFDADETVQSIVVTVQQANAASWRALENAGFRRIWSGLLDSPDPSDEGPEHLYVKQRSE